MLVVIHRISWSAFSHTRAHPTGHPRPDPNDDEDMEVPDQQELLDAFMAGLAKESILCV